MDHIFISHSTRDDAFVKELRKALEAQRRIAWTDSRELRAGDELAPEIKRAIESAGAFILVFSQATFDSAWVKDELEHALEIKKKRGDYPVIPLLLEEMSAGALKWIFSEEPIGIVVKSGPGGIAEAMPLLLAALGSTLPDDPEPMETVREEPVEKLVLELSDPKIRSKDGKRRASARARMVYRPAEPGEPPVRGKASFNFTAPIGAIDMEELRWYLERYSIWPIGVFKERAETVEKQLPEWGKSLYEQALPEKKVGNALGAWRGTDERAKRSFTVFLEGFEDEESSKKETKKAREAKEAAALLLALPWELLRDEDGYLFHGNLAASVRRQLPNIKKREVLTTEPPIRVLLASPRPEDERAGYIDHRASALPLTDALERLGKLAELTILHPPTFPALREELNRASQAEKPYHAVHFDGHGVYDREVGLGGLCFEDPRDSKKLEKRRSQIIHAEELSEVLRDHRIPLFFLDACQSAEAEESPTASVAAALLNQGVASVIAMTHSVLVETARRFTGAFYETLVKGARVGEAMLEARLKLKTDTFRMDVFGAGKLSMEDWFVPVLFQEEDDPRLFKEIPSKKIRAIDRKALEARLGELPPPPDHTFVGRSRDLLKLERLLFNENHAVIIGQGGEGKTALASELGRWLTRSSQFERAVFVSAEDHQDARSVLDRIGQQLINNYSVAQHGAGELMGKAFQPVERELKNKKTLIILDNMETILPPPQARDDSPSATEEALYEPEILKTLFQLCQKLLKAGETRLLFTSREALPKPFHRPDRVLKLGRLEKDEAVELVRQAMTSAGLTPDESDLGETQPEIEALVEAVDCHARSLALLAPYVERFGVGHAAETLAGLMSELDGKYPDSREKSLFASVELSLRRLSPELRQKLPALGLFHGGAHLSILAELLEMKQEETFALAKALIETGLAEMMEYGHLRLHPALRPYLYREIDSAVLPGLMARWAEAVARLTNTLYEQKFKDTRLAATLTLLELPNLLALLDHAQSLGRAEATVQIATTLEGLLQHLGRPRALKRVSAVREAEAAKLGEWSHVRFTAARSRIERLLESGDFPNALREARELLEKTRRAGEGAYPEAEYDNAVAFNLLGQALSKRGASEKALEPLAEARKRFQKLADQGNKSAANMASVSLAEQGTCLRDLGRLDEATEAYKKSIKRSEKLEDKRQVAVVKGQLGTVYLDQKRYQDAIEIYESARRTFEELGEAGSVATAWHQIGRVHEESGDFDAAERAYRQSLAIKTRQKNPAGEASTLDQLGNLYGRFGRPEEAVAFFKQAADIFSEIRDQAREGRVCSNLAITLIQVERHAEARREIRRAIECKEPYGHAAEPWKTWKIMSNLEQAEGNREEASRAREKAIELFLSYRRDGGENHNPGGRLCLTVKQAMRQNQTGEIKQELTQMANTPNLPPHAKPLISALLAILSGSRDPALADNPDLLYTDAAELKLLLETLDGARQNA